jgi:hypothetical protein
MTPYLKLESDLLNVSKPYQIVVGDLVRNTDKNCIGYKSIGKVIAVSDTGDITYQINSQGATYTPPNQLIKRPEDLYKIFTHTPIPGYGSFTN